MRASIALCDGREKLEYIQRISWPTLRVLSLLIRLGGTSKFPFAAVIIDHDDPIVRVGTPVRYAEYPCMYDNFAIPIEIRLPLWENV